MRLLVQAPSSVRDGIVGSPRTRHPAGQPTPCPAPHSASQSEPVLSATQRAPVLGGCAWQARAVVISWLLIGAPPWISSVVGVSGSGRSLISPARRAKASPLSPTLRQKHLAISSILWPNCESTAPKCRHVEAVILSQRQHGLECSPLGCARSPHSAIMSPFVSSVRRDCRCPALFGHSTTRQGHRRRDPS